MSLHSTTKERAMELAKRLGLKLLDTVSLRSLD